MSVPMLTKEELCLRLASGGCERFFFAPASVEPVPQRALVESCAPAPLLHMQNLAVRSQHAVVSLVCALLHARGPACVFRRVIAIHVPPLKAMVSAWPPPHIPQKHREVQPLATYGYTPPAVPRVGRGLWVGATPKHVAPSDVFRAAPFLWGLSMAPGWLGLARLFVQASARLGVAPPQVAGARFDASATVTQTAPDDMLHAPRISGSSHWVADDQSAVALPRRGLRQSVRAYLFHGRIYTRPVVGSQQEAQ